MLISNTKKGFFSVLLFVLIFGANTNKVFAQTSTSVLYVPLIGITSVPDPLSLPLDGGKVTYNYAVKTFLAEVPLSNIQVVDDTCSPVVFLNGDDNGNSRLDFNETWRYTCTTKLSKTTQSTATATGTSNNITATHKATTAVVVGSNNPSPLVSIVNTTKIAYPFSGGDITFTYKVTNPGAVPLNDVIVTDDKCSPMSGKLGDTNGNNLLDINEAWIYTCTTNLTQTATDTVSVTANANGSKADSSDTITVTIENPVVPPPLFDVGISPVAGVNSDIKFIVWGILSGILTALVILFVFTRKGMIGKLQIKQ